MKSEKAENIQTTNETITDVIAVAKNEVKQEHNLMAIIMTISSILCSIYEIIQSITWNSRNLSFTASIPWTALIPGIALILYGIVCIFQGKNAKDYISIGLTLLLIPFIITMGAMLILGIMA